MATPPLLEDTSRELDGSLATLENFFGILGFCQYTSLRATLAWIAFFVLAIALPLFVVEFSTCVGCDKVEIEFFELEILVARAIIAAVSLLCVSRNLRKYGIRKALFVDRTHGHLSEFRKLYIQKIRVFYCFLATWFGICFVLKSAREISRLIYLHHGSWWLSVILLLACLLSWSYSTLVFLSGCALFHLVGNLQIIHFENYGKQLEQDLDVSVYIEEHMSLTSGAEPRGAGRGCRHPQLRRELFSVCSNINPLHNLTLEEESREVNRSNRREGERESSVREK